MITLFVVWNVKLEYTQLPKSCCVQRFGEPDDKCHYEDLYDVYFHILFMRHIFETN